MSKKLFELTNFTFLWMLRLFSSLHVVVFAPSLQQLNGTTFLGGLFLIHLLSNQSVKLEAPQHSNF